MWDNSGTSYWSIIELNCGIMCATLPTLRPLLKKLMPSSFSTVWSSRGKNTYGSSSNNTRKTRIPDTENDAGVYIQREVELTVSSTTELKAERSSLGTSGSTEEVNPKVSRQWNKISGPKA